MTSLFGNQLFILHIKEKDASYGIKLMIARSKD